MGTRDTRVDAYIARSAGFARPILTHLRAVVHEGCPAVEETIRWGMPSFTYHGILCGMAAFTAHCTFGFWRGTLIVGRDASTTATAMGNFGRLTSLKDLPAKRILLRYVKTAMRLNEEGIKAPPKHRPRKKAAPMPADLGAGLKQNAKARAAWAAFGPGARREYIEWITEAKRPATRAERLKTTLQWVAQGKPRNWKYM